MNPQSAHPFGNGMHRCADQGRARMRSSAFMKHLAREARRFETEGRPERRPGNVVGGLSHPSVSVEKPQ